MGWEDIASTLAGLASVGVSGYNAWDVDQWNDETLAENERTNQEGRAVIDLNTATNAEAGQKLLDELTAKYDTNKSELSDLYSNYFTNTANDYSNATSDTTSRYDDIISQMQSEYAAEREKSNASYSDRTNQVMSLLEGMGDSEKADIKQAWKETQASNTQNMISSGLSGTTIMPTMNAGITRDTNSDLAALEESLRTQKSSTLSGLLGDQISADTSWANTGLNAVNSTRTTQQSALDTLLNNNIANNTLAYGNQITDTNNLNQNSLNDWYTQSQNNNTQAVNDQNTKLAWMQSVSRPYMDTTAASSSFADSLSGLATLWTPQTKTTSTDNSWIAPTVSSGTTLATTLLSDRRMKRNIKSIDSALGRVKTLNGYTYNYVSDSPENRNGGIMAQDIEKVLPEAVIEKEGIKYVKYDAVVGLIVNAVKELSDRIENIEKGNK